MKRLDELTDEAIDAMEAGAEMDAYVAEAIGIRYAVATLEGRVTRVAKVSPGATETISPHNWNPSTSWDTAMEAAENVREKYGRIVLNNIATGYRVMLVRKERLQTGSVDQLMDDFFDRSCAAVDSSGPLAICRAILKLARSRNMEIANA